MKVLREREEGEIRRLVQETAAYVQTINAHTKTFREAREKDAQERAKALLQRSLARKTRQKIIEKSYTNLWDACRFACGEERVEALTADKTAATDLHSINVLGQSALHVAARHGNHSSIKVLLRAGASVDHADADGATALHEAVRCGSVACVRVLLEGGANFRKCDSAGDLPIHDAVRGKRKRL